jgi:hypothetical protein
MIPLRALESTRRANLYFACSSSTFI